MADNPARPSTLLTLSVGVLMISLLTPAYASHHSSWELLVLLCDLGLHWVERGQGGVLGLERESRLPPGPRQLCWQRRRATRDTRPALAALPAFICCVDF